MTDVLIKRELLERAVKADASNGASSVDLVDGWKAMEQIRTILATPRQPEGDNSENPNLREGLTRYGLGIVGGITAFVSADDGCMVLHDDHQRAIAELREECERLRKLNETRGEVLIGALSETDSERDTLRQQLAERDAIIERLETGIPRIQEQSHQMRQQRDKLAGLLREARELIDRGDFREGYCMCGSGVDGHVLGDGHAPVDAGEYYAGQVRERIDAALAEVNK